VNLRHRRILPQNQLILTKPMTQINLPLMLRPQQRTDLRSRINRIQHGSRIRFPECNGKWYGRRYHLRSRGDLGGRGTMPVLSLQPSVISVPGGDQRWISRHWSDCHVGCYCCNRCHCSFHDETWRHPIDKANYHFLPRQGCCPHRSTSVHTLLEYVHNLCRDYMLPTSYMVLDDL